MRDELKRQPAAGLCPDGRARHGDLHPAAHRFGRPTCRHWRNWVDFDPLEPYGGYSLRTSDDRHDSPTRLPKPSTPTRKSNGPVGRNGHQPVSLSAVVSHDHSPASRRGPRSKQLKIGISLNHGGIAGRRATRPACQDIELTDVQRQSDAALDRRVRLCRHVVLSAGKRQSDDRTTLSAASTTSWASSRSIGLNVPTTKPMQFSEVGIGGGRVRRTQNPNRESGRRPLGGHRQPAHNPWRQPSMQSLRRSTTALTPIYERAAGTVAVSAAFFWSMGSWDPIGVRDPETSCCSSARCGSRALVTLLCFVLGYPLAYFLAQPGRAHAQPAADPGAAAVLDLAAGAHRRVDGAAADAGRHQRRAGLRSVVGDDGARS